LPDSGRATPQAVKLRYLRYDVAVADAGTFTHVARRMFIAQLTNPRSRAAGSTLAR